MRYNNEVTKLPDFTERCVRVAAKRHTKLVNAKHWLRDQHGIHVHGDVLKAINPNLRS